MKKSLYVAKWEFLEKIKTKSFIISIVLTPVIIIFFSMAPMLLSGEEPEATKVIGLIDTTGTFYKPLQEKVDNILLNNNQPQFLIFNYSKGNLSFEELKMKGDQGVINKDVEGLLVIHNGNTDSVFVEYRSLSVGSIRELRKIENILDEIRIEREFNISGADTSLLSKIKNSIDITSIKIDKEGKESKSNFLVTFFSSFIFIMLLMVMILTSGGMLIRSLLEEKSNRLIEIIASSCTSNELLIGKVLGLSALGITQMLIWILFGIAISGTTMVPLEAFNNILPIFGYFILGFVFYTALFVGIGSVVTTEQEAQQVTGYLTMVLLLPTVLAMNAIENPESFLVKILTYIPFTSPPVMILRLNVAPVQTEVIISTVLLMLAATLITIYISSKIFKIGILSYGKRPTFKELINWIKEK